MRPNTKNRSSTITAVVNIQKPGAEGVLVAEGGRFGGYSLYLKKGKLVLHYNFLNSSRYTIASDEDVPLGKSTLRYEFEARNKGRGSGGIGKLFINDRQVGQGPNCQDGAECALDRRDIQCRHGHWHAGVGGLRELRSSSARRSRRSRSN